MQSVAYKIPPICLVPLVALFGLVEREGSLSIVMASSVRPSDTHASASRKPYMECNKAEPIWTRWQSHHGSVRCLVAVLPSDQTAANVI